MSVLVVPERSLSQRMEALQYANAIRVHRARVVKPGLATGRIGLFDAVDDPLCATMEVRDVLRAMPGIGRVKAEAAMRAANISVTKTCAGLSDAQRLRLVQALSSRHPHIAIVFRAP